MFGYLNLGNPKRIGDAESQEMKNCRIDQGYLEYATFATNQLNCRSVMLPNGRTVTLTGSSDWPRWAKGSETPVKFGLDKPDVIINDPLNPTTVISRLPAVAAVAYGGQPYVAGDYTYGITLYDPATGEESMPALIDLTIGANEVAEFTNFPAVNDIFPGRPGLQWRVYRMPIGGSELLLVNHATTITANAVYAGPYQDIIEDYNLGEICDSTDNGVEALRSFGTSIIFFNDMLFIGGMGREGEQRIRFSKQGEWWAFPPENELNMPFKGDNRAFRGFAVVNETLVMFGDASISVLYGDNVENFAVKPVDFETLDNENVVINSPKAASGLVFFPVTKAEPFIYNGMDLGDADYLSSYLAFDGSTIKNISAKIKNLVLAYSPPLSATVVRLGPITEQAVIENRFLVFKLLDLNATMAGGADPANLQTEDFVWLNVVLDIQTFGWSTSDDSGKFYYRTKEFSQPREVQFHKTIWVEAEGEFTIEIYGDNRLVSSVLYNLTAKEMIYLNIRPYRYSSFSFRFIGEPGCKIYDYGVDE